MRANPCRKKHLFAVKDGITLFYKFLLNNTILKKVLSLHL
jgi:hypothetical protein